MISIPFYNISRCCASFPLLRLYDRKKEQGINAFVAIRHAYAAWGDVSSAVIAKCFRKSRFATEEESMGDDDNVPFAQ